MTIYVDSMFIPATVAGMRREWCHLVTDEYDSAELHPFAKSIGMRREWFQYKVKGRSLVAPPWLWHYDVTRALREKAIAAGATVLEGYSLNRIISAKRARFDALAPEEQVAERARWSALARGEESLTQEGLF